MKEIILKERELPYEIAEEIKKLRTNLQFCGADKRAILLTSCRSGEGKSTLALELAKSLSRLDKRVLYIDTDLRKNATAELLPECSFEKGLAHFLSAQAKWDEVLYKVKEQELYVLPAGVMPPNPSELLAGDWMKSLMEFTRKRFHYTIIDTPPLGMVVDAAVVAPLCDGAVLVVESGAIGRQAAQEVTTRLRNTQCPLLGVILNKVDRKPGKYYKKAYLYEQYGEYAAKNREG